MEIEKQRNQLSVPARWAALIGGGAAVWWGLKRRSWKRSAVALAGANYAVMGMTGRESLFRYLGFRVPGSRELSYGQGIKIRHSVTIGRSPRELYRYWKNFENLPRFMQHVESVRMIDDRHSHWTVKAPAGSNVEWDAEIVVDREDEIIGWRSTSGSVKHAGSVRFEKAPGNRGTYLRVQLQYNPPGGRLASLIARAFNQNPDQQIKADLWRFKQLMEAGEIPTTEGQPSGRAESARSRDFEERPRREQIRRTEVVETASEESFPASDAPSWTAGGGH